MLENSNTESKFPEISGYEEAEFIMLRLGLCLREEIKEILQENA